jgi:hypothetical protein
MDNLSKALEYAKKVKPAYGNYDVKESYSREQVSTAYSMGQLEVEKRHSVREAEFNYVEELVRHLIITSVEYNNYDTKVETSLIKKLTDFLYKDNYGKPAYNKRVLEWHDIDKNPDDVPDDKYEALNEDGNKVHYNPDMKEWYNERGEYTFVHKWCKLPQYEEL